MALMTGAMPGLSPDMLQALLTDPRATPQQRAGAVAQLQAMQGGGGPDMGGGAPAPAAQDADGGMMTGADPSTWLNAGAKAAAGAPEAPSAAMGSGSGSGDLAGWRGDFMNLIRDQMAHEGEDVPLSAQDKGLALARAGFGMAASGSPNFGTALGQGAVYGIEGLDKIKAQRAQERLRRDALMQTAALHGETIDAQKAAQAQASEDRRLGIQQRADAAREASLDRKDANETRRLAIQSADEAKKTAAEALADQRYATNYQKRIKQFYDTGTWTQQAGDEDHGVLGPPPDPEDEEGTPLIKSKKLSYSAKQKLLGKQPDQDKALQTSVDALDQLETTAKELLDHPGMAGAVGFRVGQAMIPGSDAASFNATLKSFKDQMFTNTANALKNASATGATGLGPISNAEGLRLESQKGPLDAAGDEETMKKSLRSVINFADQSRGNLVDAYRKTYGQPTLRAVPQTPQVNGTGNIPDEAIKMLRNSPDTAVLFDQQFGQGSAAKILGK